ncbi:hypothetical protein BGX34_005295, partial [Mortierella sp. NVP85]
SPVNYVNLIAYMIPAFGFILFVNSSRTIHDTGLDDGPPQIMMMGYVIPFIYLTTYGRYDPIENSMDNGSALFRILMMIYFFFTVLILLNVLIAVVNEVYNSQYKHSYWMFIADELSNAELTVLVDISRPQYIYYFEYDSKVEKFNARDSVPEISNLSPENRFVAESSREAHTEMQATQHMILQQISEMQRQNQETKRENQEMRRENQEIKRELSELKDMFKAFMQRDSHGTH